MNNDNFDVKALLRLWWRKRLKIGLGLIVGLVIGGLYYVYTPLNYRSEAILVPIGNTGSLSCILGLEADTIRAHDEETQLMMELFDLQVMAQRVAPARLKVRRTAHFNVVLAAEAHRPGLADSALNMALAYYDTIRTEVVRQRLQQRMDVLTQCAQRLDALAFDSIPTLQLIIQKNQVSSLLNLVDVYRSSEGLIWPQYLLLQRSELPATKTSASLWMCLGIGLLIGMILGMAWVAIRD